MSAIDSRRNWPGRHRAAAPLVLFGGLILAAATGCSVVGPNSIRGDRFNYNDAGADSEKEQLLLNLVRLRYGEAIYRLEITSMLSQRSLQVGGDISGWENDINPLQSPLLRGYFQINDPPSGKTR